MNKQDMAIAKITKECEGKLHLIPFEEYLTSICTTDAVAERILAENKMLENCYDKMLSIAKKRAVKNSAYIPPEEGFQIIREYYEITEEDMASIEKNEEYPNSEVIDITAFL